MCSERVQIKSKGSEGERGADVKQKALNPEDEIFMFGTAEGDQYSALPLRTLGSTTCYRLVFNTETVDEKLHIQKRTHYLFL